jgi:hypothetical protein
MVMTNIFLFVKIDRRQHYKALLESRLSWLRDRGFVIENIGSYWGYKGCPEGYFTRIYVDPEYLYRSRYDLNICIMVYFRPMRRADGKRDIAALRRISSDILNDSGWRAEHLTCHDIHLRQYTPFTPFTTAARIRDRLERLIGMVSKHQLKPWPEADVERWIQLQPDMHGPPIRTFQGNFTITMDR